MTLNEAIAMVKSEPHLAASIIAKASDATWSWSQSQHDDLDQELDELYDLLWK
jgi:hypothetical protein